MRNGFAVLHQLAVLNAVNGWKACGVHRDDRTYFHVVKEGFKAWLAIQGRFGLKSLHLKASLGEFYKHNLCTIQFYLKTGHFKLMIYLFIYLEKMIEVSPELLYPK